MKETDNYTEQLSKVRINDLKIKEYIDNGELIIDPVNVKITRSKGNKAVSLEKCPNSYIRFPYKRRRYRLHRVVWIAVNGIPPLKMEIGHKDNDKSNNTISNLYLCSRSKNIKDAIKAGRFPQAGLNHKLFNDEEIKSIKDRYSQGWSFNKIAEEFGCNRFTIKKYVFSNGLTKRGRAFKLKDPDGKLHQGRNLALFCRENGLRDDSIRCAKNRALKSGKTPKCKGWTILKVS